MPPWPPEIRIELSEQVSPAIQALPDRRRDSDRTGAAMAPCGSSIARLMDNEGAIALSPRRGFISARRSRQSFWRPSGADRPSARQIQPRGRSPSSISLTGGANGAQHLYGDQACCANDSWGAQRGNRRTKKRVSRRIKGEAAGAPAWWWVIIASAAATLCDLRRPEARQGHPCSGSSRTRTR
jgi:hypothetical protein